MLDVSGLGLLSHIQPEFSNLETKSFIVCWMSLKLDLLDPRDR